MAATDRCESNTSRRIKRAWALLVTTLFGDDVATALMPAFAFEGLQANQVLAVGSASQSLSTIAWQP
jgi:hypothetical protein